jgi:hypothetical protein
VDELKFGIGCRLAFECDGTEDEDEERDIVGGSDDRRLDHPRWNVDEMKFDTDEAAEEGMGGSGVALA